MVLKILLILLSVMVLTGIILLIRSAYERCTLSVSEYRIASPKLPESFDGLSFVYLSDLHDDRFGEKNKELTDRIRELNPDWLLFGGDMTSEQDKNNTPFAAFEEILEAFPDKVKYFGFGNHEYRIYTKDHRKAMRERGDELFQKYGITVLRDKIIRLDRRGKIISNEASPEASTEAAAEASPETSPEAIYLGGFEPGVEFYQRGPRVPMPSDYVEGKLGKAPEGFIIILCHTPLYMEEITSWGADLVLSGHFHGGTIRLPHNIGLMTPQFQFFNRCCYGLIPCKKGTGIVSGGLGTHTVRIRLNDKPDIVRVTLVREDPSVK